LKRVYITRKDKRSDRSIHPQGWVPIETGISAWEKLPRYAFG